MYYILHTESKQVIRSNCWSPKASFHTFRLSYHVRHGTILKNCVH